MPVCALLSGWLAGASLLAGASPGQQARHALPASGAKRPPRTPRGASEWTVYHGAPDGAGIARGGAALDSPARAWESPPLDGSVFGEPLEAAGRVVVATEDDTVYALASDSGSLLWSTRLGEPVPSGDLPCGNITPTVGVTGTPVVDLPRSEVFVVAEELVGGHPQHRLVGIDLYTGQVLLDRRVDPPGSEPATLLQRTGLTLDHGDVVFGFGGNYGDCGPYHGWLVAVPVKGRGRVRRYETTVRPGDGKGAIWMGGAAPEVGSDGDLWIATGNGATVSGAYDGSDSVVELSPSLHRVGLFAPRHWAADNAGDHDLGSTAPALLSDDEVLQVGKSYTAYLLRGTRLGGVGGQLSSTPACDGTDAGGGDAVDGRLVFVACRAGLEALDTGANRVSVRWDAAVVATGGRRPEGIPDEPPIVAGGVVWSIGGKTLYGLNPTDGAVVIRLAIGSNANDFPTPSFGDGLLLVTGGHRGDAVMAFTGEAGLPPPPSAPPR